MIGKILLAGFLLATNAQANLSTQDIKERLEIRADIYIMDKDGKKILSGPERSIFWRINPETGELSSNWSSGFDAGFIGIEQKWKVGEDGAIKVSLKEYSAQDKEHNPLGYIAEKEFALENMEPILWKVKNIKDKNFVVRFMPALREIRKPIAVESLPVAGSHVSISDSDGYLWSDDADFNGKYVGLSAHRGTIAISYVPFKGAKEMGSVDGNVMVLNVDKKFKIRLKSETDFLPAGVTAKVYAIYKPEKKSRGVGSLHSWDTSNESRIQEALK